MTLYKHLSNIVNSLDRKKDILLNKTEDKSNRKRSTDEWGESKYQETELQTAIRRWG